MKKLSLLTMPLIAISLLASCVVGQESPHHNSTSHTVDFDSCGGSFVEPQQVTDGAFATMPTNPTKKEGYFEYTFDYWYLDKEAEKFDFESTPITNDITLKAKWLGTPPVEDSYHFAFNGNDTCKVNGLNDFAIDIIACAPVQFAIIPNDNYSYPKKDDTHFVVTGEGKDNVTYDDTTGIISIKQMVGDVSISATAEVAATYTFTFTGVNCKINGKTTFTQQNIEAGTNPRFTIQPSEGFDLPLTIQIIAGKENVIKYKQGVVSIDGIKSYIEIKAVAPESKDPYKIVNFAGVNCMCDINEEGVSADYNFITRRYKPKNEDLTLYLFPDKNYRLPNDISMIFSDGTPAIKDTDYSYGEGKIIIKTSKFLDCLITLSATKPDVTYHQLTFDAGDGEFFGKRKIIQMQIAHGTNLSHFLRYFMVIQPTYQDHLFGYYDAWKGSTRHYDLTYDFTVYDDIDLLARYFNVTQPFDDLDKIEVAGSDEPTRERNRWKIIKLVAVTNHDPRGCFSIGAVKKVSINKGTHRIHIIGFNHDDLASGVGKVGITFEFYNLISNQNGDVVREHWRHGSSSHTTNDDFPNSTLNHFLNGTSESVEGSIYDKLDEFVKPNIEKLRKIVGVTKAHLPRPYDTYLFPLAVDEIAEHRSRAPEGEGTMYEYYREGRTQVKMDLNGARPSYWLRSPCEDEDVDYIYAYYCSNPKVKDVAVIYKSEKGVAPGFGV